MNALTQLRQTETRLVSSIEAAAAAVDAIATDRTSTAMASLLDAVQRCRVRLDDALAGVEGMLLGLARDMDHAAGTLEADAAQPVEMANATHGLSCAEPAVAGPTNAPPATTAAPAATPEPRAASADGIDLADPTLTTPEPVPAEASAAAIGTDAGATGVNRVAEVLGTAPAANGKGHGRQRKGRTGR